MSNDNDPRDEAMREIEAALEILIDRAAVGRGVADQRVKVLALIRSKLPQPLPVSRADDLDEWRRRNADDPGNIAVAVELDQSRTVPGMAFVVTESDGTVTRFVPENLPQPDAKPRSLLEGHGIGAGIDHRDPGAWGEDDDRFRANEEHERAVEAWRQSFNEFTVCTGGYECTGEQHARWRSVRDEALRLMRARPTAPARDWPEDAADADNGRYSCLCVTCGETFTGHKRRQECRACARPQHKETTDGN